MTFDPAGMISDIHHILELQYESDKRKGPVSAKKYACIKCIRLSGGDYTQQIFYVKNRVILIHKLCTLPT